MPKRADHSVPLVLLEVARVNTSATADAAFKRDAGNVRARDGSADPTRRAVRVDAHGAAAALARGVLLLRDVPHRVTNTAQQLQGFARVDVLLLLGAGEKLVSLVTQRGRHLAGLRSVVEHVSQLVRVNLLIRVRGFVDLLNLLKQRRLRKAPALHPARRRHHAHQAQRQERAIVHLDHRMLPQVQLNEPREPALFFEPQPQPEARLA